MRLGLLAGLSVILVGCGSSATPKTDIPQQVESSTVQTPSVTWYEPDMTKPIEKVGVSNANAIIKSAGVKVYKTSDSTDPNGEKRNIYILGDSALNAQVAISPSTVVISWIQATDTPTAIASSQQSLKVAYNISRAIFGEAGKEAISRISKGGMYKDEPIKGYMANGSCLSDICVLSLKTK